MMYHHISLVLAGAAAHFATGWVLNSDILLGHVWKKEKAKEAKDKKSCETLSHDMRLNLAAQVVVSIALSLATCVAIHLFQKSQSVAHSKDVLAYLSSWFFGQEHAVKSMLHSMYTVLFIWAGFLLPSSAEEVIWCGHNWHHWMLEMGAKLLGLISIAITVTYLS